MDLKDEVKDIIENRPTPEEQKEYKAQAKAKKDRHGKNEKRRPFPRKPGYILAFIVLAVVTGMFLSMLIKTDMLPADLREEYEDVFFPNSSTDDEYLCRIVKAADKLSALIKCIEESKTENHEFDNAGISIHKAIENMELPEADIFVTDFLPAYNLTLDELNGQSV